MRLFWCPQTRASRIVWLLGEAGVEYERVLVDVRDLDAPRPADFLAASPMGKVPALADGDVLMAESAAICLYLADRYAAGSLAPALTEPARGPFLYWLFFAPAVIEPSMAEQAAGLTPQPARNGWGSFDRMIETMEAGLRDRSWLLGDRFTAADVMVGSSVVFMRLFKMLPASPVLEAYADRCLERPAYQQTLALEQ